MLILALFSTNCFASNSELKDYEINENDFEVEITKNGEVVGLTISNKSKTPPPEKPKEETPKIEVPPIEPIKKLPVTGY